jgi:hypothetical protein
MLPAKVIMASLLRRTLHGSDQLPAIEKDVQVCDATMLNHI